MKKSILALLLAVLMVASLLPAAALAVGPTENDVAAYTNGSGTTTYYTTVGAAISAANNGGGGTIELLKNAELKASDTTSDSDKKEYPRFGWCVYVRANLILDLGDNTLTCGEFFGLAVNPNVKFTLQNGTYKHSSTGWCTAIEGTKSDDDGPGCTITIASNAIVETNGDAVVCDGYTFLGWSDGAETYSPGDEYTVTEDTTISALWKEEYNVVYIYNNGAATGHKTVLKGESVILPTPSKSGYAFLGWACSDGNVYDGGDSVVIWGNTTFEASWVRHPDTPYVPEPSEPVEPDVPSFPFYDVPTSAWYYTAVKYVYDNKLMDGVDTYTFAPNDTLTRAMVWTIIARMSGVDTTGGATWYAKAQEWVVVNGVSDGENPTAAITRQELVTMLYRYAQIKGYDVSVGESTNILSYVDATSISEYAMSAFQWACGSGLTEGDENGALTPLATATRAQAAAMIMRFCESVK